MSPESNYFLALRHALETNNAGAIESLVQRAYKAYAKALFFGARQPRIYTDLIFIAWQCVEHCEVRSTRLLLAAGLPIESILLSRVPHCNRFTVLETAVCAYYPLGGVAAQTELIDLLLAAGASYTREIQHNSHFRVPAPITSFVRTTAVARVFMKHGVAKSAFTGMRRDIRARL